MSDKPAKPKKKGRAAARKDEAGVLGNLPATRTTRVGGARSRGSATATRAKPNAAAKPKAAASKPKAAAKPKPVAATSKPKAAAKPKPVAAASKPKAAAKPKPVAAASKPKAAAKPKRVAAASKPKAAAKPKPIAATPAPEPRRPRRPRPVRAGAPALKDSTERARSEASEPLERGSKPPTGTELVTTAIQAAGELAQIGLTVGGQVLKRAVDRLPKP